MERIAIAIVGTLVAAMPAAAAPLRCAADSVKVGNTCVDKYEASVWEINPIASTSLVKKVQAGKATLADLTAGGALQLGCTVAPYNHTAYPSNFPATGQWTPILTSSPPSPGVYAVSIPGVLPTACTTWFQAAQACALSGKRLITNREWQDGAAGTPDPGTDNGTTDCNVSTAGVQLDTGSRSGCVSSWGAFDMVGNVAEWVADWVDRANGCTSWSATYGSDISCFGGPGMATSNLPGAMTRGGIYLNGADAGVFQVVGNLFPSDANSNFGFRCAR